MRSTSSNPLRKIVIKQKTQELTATQFSKCETGLLRVLCDLFSWGSPFAKEAIYKWRSAYDQFITKIDGTWKGFNKVNLKSGKSGLSQLGEGLGLHDRVVKSVKFKFWWLSHRSVGSNPSPDTCVLEQDTLLLFLTQGYKWVQVDIVYEKAFGTPRQLRAVYAPGSWERSKGCYWPNDQDINVKPIEAVCGCVRLASLCRPRSAHSGEPLTRANRTITHPLVVTSCTWGQPQVTHSTSRVLGADLGEPLEWRQSYSNVPGADQCRPREANRTHPMWNAPYKN